MSKPRIHRLGDLQLEILKALWAQPEATVAQVLAALTHRKELAYTTVATMLRKMEARGLVAHRAAGRSFHYHARVAAADISRSLTNHWVDRLFAGSLIEAVHHLLTTRDVSRRELVELERLIAERKNQT